jgi:TRAP-type C4-dicarboxylate transport system permease small subunit
MPAVAPVFARRLLAVLAQVERVLCVSAFLLLVAVLFADVLSRELTAAGLYWAPQIGVWANVFVVMAGFGLASTAGAHLRPRFADDWLPQAWGRALEFLQHFVMALFCLAIAGVALSVVVGSWRLGEVELNLFLPVWPVQAILPAAFLAGALRHFIYAFCAELRPVESGAFHVARERVR